MADVNSLPNEILVLIFHDAMNAQPLGFERMVDGNLLPVHRLAISQVCRQWRKAVLSSWNLWTHIDISTRHELVSLGEICVSHTGNLPLSIRFVEPLKGEWKQDELYLTKLKKFIGEFGPRTSSLEIISHLPVPDYKIWFTVLQLFLRHPSSKLMRFVLSNRDSPECECLSLNTLLILADSRPRYMYRACVGRQLGIPKQRLEKILANVRILELDLAYLLWESRAYHDLTELRLTGPRRLTAICTITQLAHILEPSPRLRVLHFGLEVGSTEATPNPIQLVDLEVFLLKSLSFHTQQAVLRLIFPGTKQLQMSTTYDDVAREYFPTLGKEEELGRFFNRTSIVYLQLHSLVCVEPQLLLSLLPNLQSLVFRQATVVEASGVGLASSICPGLTVLHFISCTIHLNGFLWLVSGRHMQDVKIWDSRIGYAVENHPAEHYRDTLIEACPMVQFLGMQDYDRMIKIEGWGEDMKDRISKSREDGGYKVYY